MDSCGNGTREIQNGNFHEYVPGCTCSIYDFSQQIGDYRASLERVLFQDGGGDAAVARMLDESIKEELLTKNEGNISLIEGAGSALLFIR